MNIQHARAAIRQAGFLEGQTDGVKIEDGIRKERAAVAYCYLGYISVIFPPCRDL